MKICPIWHNGHVLQKIGIFQRKMSAEQDETVLDAEVEIAKKAQEAAKKVQEEAAKKAQEEAKKAQEAAKKAQEEAAKKAQEKDDDDDIPLAKLSINTDNDENDEWILLKVLGRGERPGRKTKQDKTWVDYWYRCRFARKRDNKEITERIYPDQFEHLEEFLKQNNPRMYNGPKGKVKK